MRFALITLLLALTGCSAVAIDYQPDQRFDGYHSYAYSDPKGQAESLDQQRIRNAVMENIARTGLDKAPADEADLLVRGRVVDVSRLERSGFSFGLGTRRDNVGFGLVTAPPVREVEEGKVVVEMVDREANQVIWQAEGRRNLTPGMSPKSRIKLINKLVKEMFGNYPPGRQ